MSCRRVEEMDLMAFTADRLAPQWAEFREHYPTCPSCTAAVAELADFEALLREGSASGGAGHVSEAELISHIEGQLSGASLARVQSHLAGCPMCRTEMAVIQQFEPAQAFVPETAVAPERDAQSWVSGLRDFFASLTLPTPALGLAVAVLVGLLVMWSQWDVNRGAEAPRVAEDEAPRDESGRESPMDSPREESFVERDSRSEPEPEPEPGPLLAEEEPAPKAPEGGAEPERPNTREREVQVAQPEPTEVVPERATTEPRSVEPAESIESEPILLAALLPSDLPAYARPGSAMGDPFEALRFGGTSRGSAASGSVDLPKVFLWAPPSTGLTGTAAPRLYWSLDRESPVAIEIAVTAPDADLPAFESRLEPPVRSGLHSIDLAEAGVSLALGERLEWSVTLVLDEAARDKDVFAVAAVKRIPETRALSLNAPAAEDPRKIHDLAAIGRWYDAIDRVQRWLEIEPKTDRLIAYRRELLDEVGLQDVSP